MPAEGALGNVEGGAEARGVSTGPAGRGAAGAALEVAPPVTSNSSALKDGRLANPGAR